MKDKNFENNGNMEKKTRKTTLKQSEWLEKLFIRQNLKQTETDLYMSARRLIINVTSLRLKRG